MMLCVCPSYSADYRMVKMLLSHGAQVNVADVVGNTPLHTATIYGHTELVKLLLQHSAEVYRKGQHGALAIHMAAREGHANLVRLFCQFAEVCILYFIHMKILAWLVHGGEGMRRRGREDRKEGRIGLEEGKGKSGKLPVVTLRVKMVGYFNKGVTGTHMPKNCLYMHKYLFLSNCWLDMVY